VLFLVHLAIFCVIAFISFGNVDFKTMQRKGNVSTKSTDATSDSPPPLNFSGGPANGMVAAAFAGFFFSLMYLFAMRRFPRQLIKGTFVIYLVSLSAMVVFMFVTGYVNASL
jgi:hypothetical protein